MAATGELKARIQLLQAAVARGEATGKSLRPEIKAELDSYREQGLLGGNTGGASGSGAKPTEAQSKAVGFLTRALGANEQFEKVGVAPRGVVTQGVVDMLPDGVANSLTSDERQVSENAQRDFVTATLRQESGAAISAGEYENQRKTFFPQPGDGEAVIKAKAAARRRALDGLIAASGSVISDDLRKQYASYFPSAETKGGDQASGTAGAAGGGSGEPPSGPGGGAPQQNADAGGTVQFGDEAPPTRTNALKLTDEQWQTFQQAAMSGASADRLAGIATAFNRPPDAEGMKNLEGIAAYYAKPENRKTPLGVSYQRDEITPVDPGDGIAGAAYRGATSNIPFSREIAAGIDTITDPNTTYAENLDREKGYRAYSENEHPFAYGTGAVIGSLPIGGIELTGARSAARAAGIAALRSGAGRQAADIAAARVFATRTAADAAAMGGTYSFGNADGDLGDRLVAGGTGAVIAGATGGAAAYGGSRFASRLAARARNAAAPVATGGQQTLAAMERQGITPFAADVGGPATRLATSGTAQTLGGVGPIRRAAQATLDTAQAVRDRVATSMGAVVNPEQAGEVARAGANAFKAQTSARIRRLYDRAEQAAGQTAVDTPEALRVLNQELGPLEESAIPSAGLGVLQGLREGLSTPTTIRGIRATRTQLRSAFENTGQRGSNEERIANRVLDAAADDITNGLRAAGQDTAARQYAVADRMWRDRLRTIDEHLAPILGDDTGPRAKSGEQIVAGLKTAMSSNNRRFVGFMNALPAEEQGIVRASLISRLGQAPKGQQDEAGEVFSLASFLTHWNDIGESAKQRLFGADGRAALNDLATVANSAKNAQRYANVSNTGAAVTTSALGTAAALGPLGWAAAAKMFAGQYAAGRLLASPRFARWLARPPRQATPAAAQAYVGRLTRIARAEPAIASDVLSIRDRLASMVTGSGAPVAADERPDAVAGVQGNGGQQDRQNNGAQP